MSAPDGPGGRDLKTGEPSADPRPGTPTTATASASGAAPAHNFGLALHPRPPWDRPRHREANPNLYDPLTLLPNRALFLDRLSMALTRSHRSGEPLAVVLCEIDDVDGFVAREGRAALDVVLAAVGKRLEHCVRTADTVGRGYADQFLLLCERLVKSEDVTVVLERVHESMAVPIPVDGGEHVLTMSLGAVITNDPMLEFEELIDEAADLLDLARDAGGGRSQVSDWSFQIFGQAAAVLESRKVD